MRTAIGVGVSATALTRMTTAEIAASAISTKPASVTASGRGASAISVPS